RFEIAEINGALAGRMRTASSSAPVLRRYVASQYAALASAGRANRIFLDNSPNTEQAARLIPYPRSLLWREALQALLRVGDERVGRVGRTKREERLEVLGSARGVLLAFL